MIEQRCLDVIESTRFDSLDAGEQERLMVLLIHDFAMGSAASDTEFARNMVDKEQLRDRGYTLFGRTDRSRSFDMAVQYNAMAITASIREDFVSGTHPGAILFPLLLAQTERSSLEVSRMLDAAAVGLKLSLLLTDAYGKAFAAKGFRPTTALHAMAGAAALSRLQGSSPEDAMKALSAAAGMVQGLAFAFQEGSEEWLVQVPLAAEAAILAVRNAPSMRFYHPNPLSGERSLSSWLGVDSSSLAASPETLKLTRIGVKKHPVNSFVQPVVEAVLRTGAGGYPDGDVAEVLVVVPQEFSAMMPTLAATGPFPSPNLGLLSIPASVALAIQGGGLVFSDFRRSNDADVAELASKVRIEFSLDLKQYDVHVKVRKAGEDLEQHLETSAFYPSLQEEIQWTFRQYPHPIPWTDRVLQWFEAR